MIIFFKVTLNKEERTRAHMMYKGPNVHINNLANFVLNQHATLISPITAYCIAVYESRRALGIPKFIYSNIASDKLCYPGFCNLQLLNEKLKVIILMFWRGFPEFRTRNMSLFKFSGGSY